MKFFYGLSYLLSALCAFAVYWFFYASGRQRHWEEESVDDDLTYDNKIMALRGKLLRVALHYIIAMLGSLHITPVRS